MPRPRGTSAHGTITGYTWHKNNGEEPCEPCLLAKRDYSREAARSKKQQERAEAPRREAWQRACARLAERYPAEFREILMEEMRGVIQLPPDDDEGEAA